MTFDKPEHQQIVAQLIEQAQFPGKFIEVALDLKRAVERATVAEGHPEAAPSMP